MAYIFNTVLLTVVQELLTHSRKVGLFEVGIIGGFTYLDGAKSGESCNKPDWGA